MAATEPLPPFNRCLAILLRWRVIRFRRVTTVGTGVRRPTGLHLTRPDAEQMTFVLEHAPHLAAHRRIVPPVAKTPANALPASFRFEGVQLLATNQAAIPQHPEQ